MALRQIPAYFKAVFKHGWLLLIAVVGGIGDIATVLGDFPVPRWLWYSLIAFGVAAAQFGAYCDVKAELAQVRGRLRELDTDEAKRAYLDDCIAEALALIEDVAAHEADWYGEDTRVLEDVSHWESGVRAEIRKAWGSEQARRFDLHPDTQKPERYRGFDPASAIQEYIQHRITRLAELRDETD